ncbi:Uncharacterised protein [Mycobacteroides abscessus subsp. abscessus]|nr:Uncharacterised protein [Mycobacteroides abscessus subsp. abscessus]
MLTIQEKLMLQLKQLEKNIHKKKLLQYSNHIHFQELKHF